MTLSLQELLRRPGLSSIYEELCFGRVRWDLVHPFPAQEAADRAAGDDIVGEAIELVTKLVDPDTIEATKVLPPGLVETLRDRGFLKLATEPALNGRGMSYLNVFRVVTAVASWSVPVALVLAVESGIGMSAFEPILPAGTLRDEVRARLARGVVSGGADTEPAGAANSERRTTATPVENGAAFLISGEKIHIGNASIADWMTVSATLDGQTRMFFFDTRTPGLRVRAVHEFMGIKGFPNAALTFDRVRVPREWMLVEDSLDRMTPSALTLAIRGRMFLIVAPSLALARASAQMAREFAVRRSVNGQGLGEYEEIQRLLTDTLAEVFAIETLAEWCLITDQSASGVNPALEQMVAKNVASLACWRAVDRTMSLLAGEGFEVAASKAARGVPPSPMERVFRDARGLRISGGVDFMLDIWLGRYILSSWYVAAGDGEPATNEVIGRSSGMIASSPPAGDADEAGAAASDSGPAPADLDDGELSPRNQAHLRVLRAEAAAFAQACRGLIRAYPEPEALYARERIVILVSQILNELTTMTLVLARASRLAAGGDAMAQDLADAYCCAARLRVGGWRRELEGVHKPDGEPAFAAVSREWLHGAGLDFLLKDVATEVAASRVREPHGGPSA